VEGAPSLARIFGSFDDRPRLWSNQANCSGTRLLSIRLLSSYHIYVMLIMLSHRHDRHVSQCTRLLRLLQFVLLPLVPSTALAVSASLRSLHSTSLRFADLSVCNAQNQPCEQFSSRCSAPTPPSRSTRTPSSCRPSRGTSIPAKPAPGSLRRSMCCDRSLGPACICGALS
jgi:hypothetical protein